MVTNTKISVAGRKPEEIEALLDKINNPEKIVLCPRCGKKLSFNKVGSISYARCTTYGCIRGINDYTEEEQDAIREKKNNPEADVTCPRCGNEIIYKEVGNSICVKCLTEGCIFGGIRGL